MSLERSLAALVLPFSPRSPAKVLSRLSRSTPTISLSHSMLAKIDFSPIK